MQTADSNNIICKSYFQHASDSEISQSFTQKWIELINLLEKRNDTIVNCVHVTDYL